jgi:alpha-L-arabinofuranosidase
LAQIFCFRSRFAAARTEEIFDDVAPATPEPLLSALLLLDCVRDHSIFGAVAPDAIVFATQRFDPTVSHVTGGGAAALDAARRICRAGAAGSGGQRARRVQRRLTLRTDRAGARSDRNIYGSFAEHLGRGIYEGIWVGEGSPIPNTRGIRNDIIAALRNLKLPVLRWPGGCFADEYHWRDGIGPRSKRPRRVNTSWGGIETDAFGLHEFMDLVELVGAEPYISVNVGSGTPQEMMDWLESMTSDSDSELARLRLENGRDKPWKLKYVGVGNESWG